MGFLAIASSPQMDKQEKRWEPDTQNAVILSGEIRALPSPRPPIPFKNQTREIPSWLLINKKMAVLYSYFTWSVPIEKAFHHDEHALNPIDSLPLPSPP